jgi:hypothetical protein
MSRGAKSLLYKDLLNQLEAASPGSKQSFLFGFLDKARPLFHEQEEVELHPCERCGQPTTTPTCAFCRLRDEVSQPRRPRGGRRRGGRSGLREAAPAAPASGGSPTAGLVIPLTSVES